MTGWHMAQINVARALSKLDDPRMADFMAQLDAINRLAEKSPGFVWRLQDDSGTASGIKVDGDPDLVVNMSVWENIEDLFAFACRSAHQPVMARRRQWFTRPDQACQALWWVERGLTPTPEAGLERLALLQQGGPTADAFNFKTRFPQPHVGGGADDMEANPYCVGWQ